jgi:hypothetical protein
VGWPVLQGHPYRLVRRSLGGGDGGAQTAVESNTVGGIDSDGLRVGDIALVASGPNSAELSKWVGQFFKDTPTGNASSKYNVLLVRRSLGGGDGGAQTAVESNTVGGIDSDGLRLL